MLSMHPPKDWPDADVIAQFKKTGDNHWVGILYERYLALVYGVCLKYLKNREDSRDAAMHIFEKLPSNLNAFDIAYFKGWLYTTARNHCLMAIRAKKGKFIEGLDTDLMENLLWSHPDKEEGLEQDLTRLERCIEELVLEQKHCVQLFFLQQKCYRDIAQQTGHELNKVKSHIQNGKRNLKICMERNA